MANKVKKSVPKKKHGATLSNVVNTYVHDEIERQRYSIQENARLITMDMVTIALGRIGMRETKFKKFRDALNETWLDYGELISDVKRDDPDLWEAKAKIDRELQLYVGKEFVPWEQRHWDIYAPKNTTNKNN